MAKKHFVIGTRGSPLAMAQSEGVRQDLLRLFPACSIDLKIIKTSGDLLLDSSLQKLGGKGLFIKEIEQALAEHEIDLAVHSLKDCPHTLESQFSLACTPIRESPLDVLLSRDQQGLQTLPRGARIGTSSLRRSVQLRQLRGDLGIVPVRGNVGTRIERLKRGDFEGLVLAEAGLKRLGMKVTIAERLAMIPAVGQGALGIEIRSNDDAARALVSPLNDSVTHYCVAIERRFMQIIKGDCYTAMGCHARVQDQQVYLQAFLANPLGHELISRECRGKVGAGAQLIETLAQQILEAGGRAWVVT